MLSANLKNRKQNKTWESFLPFHGIRSKCQFNFFFLINFFQFIYITNIHFLFSQPQIKIGMREINKWKNWNAKALRNGEYMSIRYLFIKQFNNISGIRVICHALFSLAKNEYGIDYGTGRMNWNGDAHHSYSSTTRFDINTNRSRNNKY